MSADRHLRRLRWRLTAVYAAVMAVSLVAFSFLVIGADRRVRAGEMDQDLLAQAQLGANAVSVTEDGELIADRYYDEPELFAGYPLVFVVGAGPEGGLWLAAGPEDDWLAPELEDYARSVLYEGNIWTWGVAAPEPDLDVRVRGTPVLDADGEPRAAVIAAADFRDWMDGHGRLRAQVLAAAAGLVLASGGAAYWLAGRGIRPAARSLAQQERLIADAAHELRTPVARILAAAEGGIAHDEPPEAALERVAGLAGAAGGLLDDLLTLARMDAGGEELRREKLRLDLLAERVAADRPGVRVEAVATVVEGDAGLLGRAVDNLVANAVEHGTPDGETPDVLVTVYPTRVVVADRGPGVDPAVAERAFERFHAGPGSPGHGLGLPIAAWVAEAHGGRVTLAPRDGGGIEATLSLPDRAFT